MGLKTMVFCTTLALACSAFGHAHLVRSNPKADSISVSPKRITLEFSEPLEVKLSKVAIFKLNANTFAQGYRLAPQYLKQLNSKNALPMLTSGLTSNTIEVSVRQTLTKGVYLVVWKTLSTDGHLSSDALVFKVN